MMTKIESVLGEGTFGKVRLGTHLVTEEKVKNVRLIVGGY